jgi:hypothetical protein
MPPPEGRVLRVPNFPRCVPSHPIGDRGKPTRPTRPPFPLGDSTRAAGLVTDSRSSSLRLPLAPPTGGTSFTSPHLPPLRPSTPHRGSREAHAPNAPPVPLRQFHTRRGISHGLTKFVPPITPHPSHRRDEFYESPISPVASQHTPSGIAGSPRAQRYPCSPWAIPHAPRD